MSRCELTTAIVARHLDGDVQDDGAALQIGWRPGDFLGDHLRQCSACQLELQRCRRLDAALASAAGRAAGADDDPVRLLRLVDRAIAIAAAPTRAPARRWSALRSIAAGGALLLAGFALAMWSGAAAPPPPPPPLPPMASSDATPPLDPQVGEASPAGPHELPFAGIPLGSLPTTIGTWRPKATDPLAAPPRTRADARQLGDLLGDAALGDRLWLSSALVLGTLRAAPTAAAAEAAADAARRRAAILLLEAAHPGATDAWIRAMAAIDGGPLLAACLSDARRRPDLQRQIAARLAGVGAPRGGALADLAIVTIAARLGGREVDQALRQLLRRANLQEELAAALRLPHDRDGRTALLLDVWGDLVARGRGGDEDLARTLFLGQPRSAGGELAAELQTCRQTPRRVRCLLALGQVGGETARSTLLAAIDAPVQTEAFAAGFGLAQLPHDDLRDLLSRAQRPGAWLLRATLCCAGLDASRRWLRDLDLTDAEIELLTCGGCTLQQFPVLAGLLRDRSPTTL